jgi:hypothetical protein
MLRGINVGGHKPVKMEQLRKSFEKLGCTNVKTYVQSGNVVFEAPRDPILRWQEKIEKQIARDFGFSVQWPATVSGQACGVDLVTAVGPLLGAQIGEFLRLRGRWSTHPKHGQQFEVASYATVLPTTADNP